MKFGKKSEKATTKNDGLPAKEMGYIIKHPKPKVLFLDVEEKAVKALQEGGWNVAIGSLGRPYKVPKKDGFVPVIVKPTLPNFTEQEIVVIDLNYTDPANGPEGEKHTPDGELDWWVKCSRGIVDPRPRTMWHVKESFDRILQNGGVFIIFADNKKHQKIILARKSHHFYDERNIEADIWDFLTVLENVDIVDDHGEEMFAVLSDPIIGKLVCEHLSRGSFQCIVRPRWEWEKNTNILAVSKFDDAPVGLVHYFKKSAVIIVPQLANKHIFLTKLISEALPAIVPHLFPSLERGRWIHKVEYELPRVIELESKKLEVEQKAKAEIDLLSLEVTKEQELLGWQYDLLTGTDHALVEAVKKALRLIGFQNIVDVDDERHKEGKTRREDLQIHDLSPVLIVDVKGVGGLPSDAEVLQADKHATIRMREWERTDVVPLSIINHQRHLPPLDRENKMPFRKEILDHAAISHLGLMTTWDLFRLVRSFQKHGWRPEDVKPLFYHNSRISIIPIHYKYIGRVAHIWKQAFSLIIEEGAIKVGDRIAFESVSEFEEMDVSSLQICDNVVESTSAGVEVGIKCMPHPTQLKNGMRIFSIQRTQNGR